MLLLSLRRRDYSQEDVLLGGETKLTREPASRRHGPADPGPKRLRGRQALWTGGRSLEEVKQRQASRPAGWEAGWGGVSKGCGVCGCDVNSVITSEIRNTVTHTVKHFQDPKYPSRSGQKHGHVGKAETGVITEVAGSVAGGVLLFCPLPSHTLKSVQKSNTVAAVTAEAAASRS